MTQHILGVARTLPFHSIGGMQAIAWDLFREFARLGHKVTVITTSIPGKKTPFVADGVHVIPLEGTRPERCDSRWWQASAQWFENAIQNDKFEGILSVSSAGAEIARRRNKLPGARFVFQAHGSSWGELVSKWRTGRPIQLLKSVRNLYWLIKDPFVYRKFDHIAVVSDVLMTEFNSPPINWLTSKSAKILIRNGVNEHVFHPNNAARSRVRKELGWLESDHVAVFAARLHPQKGGEATLKAFQHLRINLPSAKLLFIGGGEDLDRLRLIAAELGCSDQVHFTGSLAREEVAPLLSTGDVFVFPTLRREGLTMNVLEALACGMPAVCSLGTKSDFTSSLSIHYVDPTNVAAISSAMKAAMSRIRSESSLLTTDYSLAGCAQRYLDILLLKRGG